ncbi:MAG: T9SS type A sorting domain-containing protein [Ferruginibacter sp.]|nr:T9SS type A sorting domain-containing protein [Cytophagales bacterium]
MKTSIIRFAAMAAFSAASFVNPSYADDKPTLTSASIEPYGQGKKMQVILRASDSKRPASIRIRNTKGEIVYQEYVRKTRSFRKVYDLNQLENGVYTMEIVRDGNHTRKTFALENTLYNDALRVIFLAGSSQEHFRIGMENVTGSDVSLTVKDADGKTVHQETLANVHKKLLDKNFATLPVGEYTVNVQNATGNFSKKLIINK